MWMLRLVMVLVGLSTLVAACSEDRAAEGEACDVAQDCKGALVCAKLAPDTDDKVCADVDDTREDTGCEREYVNMRCGLVLKQAPDAGM